MAQGPARDAAPIAQEPAPQSAPCTSPPDLTAQESDFSNVRAALHAGLDVDVLAIGSATMIGPGGDMQGSVPARMANALHAAFPAANIRLTVRSGRGLTASDMLAALPGELAEHPFRLVLWQTATVEAVRTMPADELFQRLSNGARLVHDASADLVLIDPQFSRFLRANTNLDPYLQTMQRAASLPGVFLLRRYDLMREWVDTGEVDLERAGKAERQAVADRLHECLGRVLAQIILRGS